MNLNFLVSVYQPNLNLDWTIKNFFICVIAKVIYSHSSKPLCYLAPLVEP
jgi:hypothetical protein